MKPLSYLATRVIALALLTGSPAWADDGHGHDHDEAPAPSGTAQPRFTATSETFELVGVLDGKQLTLYLDRYADNSPVPGAKLELDIAGKKLIAEAHDEVYEVALAEAPPPGVLAITATVEVGNETDLLAGELDVHDADHAEDVTHSHSWKAYTASAAAALLALALLAALARHRVARRLAQGASA